MSLLLIGENRHYPLLRFCVVYNFRQLFQCFRMFNIVLLFQLLNTIFPQTVYNFDKFVTRYKNTRLMSYFNEPRFNLLILIIFFYTVVFFINSVINLINNTTIISSDKNTLAKNKTRFRRNTRLAPFVPNRSPQKCMVVVFITNHNYTLSTMHTIKRMNVFYLGDKPLSNVQKRWLFLKLITNNSATWFVAYYSVFRIRKF